MALFTSSQAAAHDLLMKAAKQGDPEGIKKALAAGAPIEESLGPASALCLALQSLQSPVESAQALLTALPRLANAANHRGRTPLQFALGAPTRRELLARVLFEAGADPRLHGQNDAIYLREILSGGLSDALALARLALEHGANPNERDLLQKNTALDEMIASVDDKSEFIALLGAFGANALALNEKGEPPLVTAIERPIPRLKNIEALIAIGADPNSRALKRFSLPTRASSGRSPLTSAARLPAAQRLAVINALLAAKADPNALDANGDEPFHLAFNASEALGSKPGERSLDLCIALAEAGAKPRPRPEYKNLLHAALSSPNGMPLIQMLLRAKIDPNTLSKAGDSPLRSALLSPSPSSALPLVKELLSHGAIVEGEDKKPPPLLALALKAPENALELTQALLSAGANPNWPRMYGPQPLEIARSLRANSAPLIAALLKAGAVERADKPNLYGSAPKKSAPETFNDSPSSTSSYGNEHPLVDLGLGGEIKQNLQERSAQPSQADPAPLRAMPSLSPDNIKKAAALRSPQSDEFRLLKIKPRRPASGPSR